MDFAAARKNMIASQIKTNRVTDPLVIEAMSVVPRENFIPDAQRAFAYVDKELPIGNGRMIMEPMVLARLLQLADVQTTHAALVIGAGEGYCAAVLSHMARSVLALESDGALVARATKTLADLKAQNVMVVTGDLKAGKPNQGPFDVILINGAVDAIPEALKQQLADGGRLVCIVREGPLGRATLVERSGNAFGQRQDFDCTAALLPGLEKQAMFVF